MAHAIDKTASKTRSPARDPKERLRRQYGRYFPADAWELQNAKVLESDQAIFFVREYKNLPDGRVELHPFTMLMLPRDQRDVPPAPGASKAIVLEAPQGAVLQFDTPFDLKKARIGKLVGGNLAGPIHIHNAPIVPPGSENEIDIVTRDVVLIDDHVVTPHKVDFRFGPNVGSGRDLKITLAQREGEDAKARGANFSGVRALELTHDVQVRVQLGGKGLLPGGDKKESDKPAGGKAATPAAETERAIAAAAKQNGTSGGKPVAKPGDKAKSDPPVRVTCTGPFVFDVLKSVATFSERVNVVRLNPVGEQDTMTCDRLAIYFVQRASAPPANRAAAGTNPPAQPGGSPAAQPIPVPPPADATSKDSLSNLEARMVEARGELVIVNSPSNGGHARCQKLEYDVRDGTIRMEAAPEILLHQGPNEIRCPKLDYQPAKTGRLGKLNAAGPGTLQGAMPDNPAHKYSARWSQQLLMQPDAECHRVSLLGSAQMRMTDTGSLAGDEILIWVTEPPPGSSPAPRRRPRRWAPPAARGACKSNGCWRCVRCGSIRRSSPERPTDWKCGLIDRRLPRWVLWKRSTRLEQVSPHCRQSGRRLGLPRPRALLLSRLGPSRAGQRTSPTGRQENKSVRPGRLDQRRPSQASRRRSLTWPVHCCG